MTTEISVPDIGDFESVEIIEILVKGNNLFQIIQPLIEEEDELVFNKLNNESFNFTNSLKLLLGKKIRIKAEKQNL